MTDSTILGREQQLRAWFTQNCDPLRKVIDGLDIGWGGFQRWATAQMPAVEGRHLDVACGYATFLAQLGWRFPSARLIGLNIDFDGPHALARPLLAEAVIDRSQRPLDVRWEREAAERAITLYAEGWAAQARPDDESAGEQTRRDAHRRMMGNMKRQLAERGYYIPFGPVRTVVARRKLDDSEAIQLALYGGKRP
jgi:hypothetical protein